QRNLDLDDPHIPLLAWWAVEAHALGARDLVLKMFGTAEAWHTPFVRDAILERLMRRYSAEGSAAGLASCARLLSAAPSSERGRLLAALEQGLQDRPARPRSNVGTLFNDLAVVVKPEEAERFVEQKLPTELARHLDASWKNGTADVALIRVCARLERPAAKVRAVALAADLHADRATRLAMLGLLADIGDSSCVDALLRCIGRGEPEAIQLAVLSTLQRFDRPEIAAALVRHYPNLSPRLRAAAVEV